MDNKDINEQIKEYIPLLRNIIKSYRRNYSYLMEDIYQIGLVAIWKALTNFDVTKEIPFTAYCTIVIKNSINSFLRKESKLNKIIYNKSTDSITEGENIENFNLSVSDIEAVIGQCEIKELKENIKSALSYEENKIFILLLEEYTHKEISEMLKWDINKFYYVHKKLKNKVKGILKIWGRFNE